MRSGDVRWSDAQRGSLLSAPPSLVSSITPIMSEIVTTHPIDRNPGSQSSFDDEKKDLDVKVVVEEVDNLYASARSTARQVHF